MSCKNKVITSEYVSWGHPDKLADQIADQILGDLYQQDPDTRAGIEVMVKDNIVTLGGEVKTYASINYEESVKKVFDWVKYPEDHHLNPDNIKVINLIGKQSPEISTMVDKYDGEIGAGDQGFMVGYASNETPQFFPLGHYIARRLCFGACEVVVDRKERLFCGPDAKTQVVVSYDEDEKPNIEYVLVSVMHPKGTLDKVRERIKRGFEEGEFFHHSVYEKYIEGKNIKIEVNPCGEWTVGGPIADCGVTGRKIVVDQFGGYCNVGGGAFSGKDFSKVDRSAAYMCRYIAKNIVATGICDNAKVELAYVIGKTEPCAINIELNRNCDRVCEIKEWLTENVDMSPRGIIDKFKDRGNQLCFVNYARIGSYGYEEYRHPWEALDLVDELKDYLKL